MITKEHLKLQVLKEDETKHVGSWCEHYLYSTLYSLNWPRRSAL